MTERIGPLRRRLSRVGLRVRLTALFTAATIALVAVGGIGLALVLRKGLNDNVDAALATRLDQADVDALRAGGSAGAPSEQDPDSITQVLDRTGDVLYSEPAQAPAALSAADAAAADAEPQARTITFQGQRTRIMWSAPSGGDEVLVVGADLAATAEDAADIDGALLWAAPVIVVVAGVATWLLAGAALRPVEQMRADAAAISASDSDRRITVPPARDSISALAATLNLMLDRLHDALRRERDFVADAGHELRTPLTVLRTELELAARPGRTEAELRDAIGHASREVERLTALSSSLLELAKAEATRPAAAARDISSVLDDAIRARRAAAESARVDLIADYPPAVLGVIEPGALRQVIDNLLDNALRHTPAGGVVVLRVAVAAPWVDIHVQDSGPGMPADFLDRAFDRFRMADESRSERGPDTHAGLGLSIARAIVDSAGGAISAANIPSGGLDIQVRLPAG